MERQEIWLIPFFSRAMLMKQDSHFIQQWGNLFGKNRNYLNLGWKSKPCFSSSSEILFEFTWILFSYSHANYDGLAPRVIRSGQEADAKLEEQRSSARSKAGDSFGRSFSAESTFQLSYLAVWGDDTGYLKLQPSYQSRGLILLFSL